MLELGESTHRGWVSSVMSILQCESQLQLMGSNGVLFAGLRKLTKRGACTDMQLCISNNKMFHSSIL